MIPEAVTHWCSEHGYGEVSGVQPVGGGCINNGARLETSSGQSLFLKQNDASPKDMFPREFEGLEALAVEGGPRVPTPFLADRSFLLTEDLRPASPAPGYWERLGRELAQLHRHSHSRFGFEHDNYIGSTPQSNPWTDDGHEFFAESRLGFQADLARGHGWLSKTEAGRVGTLAARLPELVPEQPASLLHGDLWSGNATSGDEGEPAIIDPAAHYGWAEAELGMTSLFGGFPRSFYDAYQEINPLAPGWQERLSIYNLYHLLNHLNLFGRSYYGRVISILDRYT